MCKDFSGPGETGTDWPKQDTRPAQIPEVEKETPPVNGRTLQVTSGKGLVTGQRVICGHFSYYVINTIILNTSPYFINR